MLWPVWSPCKVLPQVGLSIVGANRGPCVLHQSVSGFPRVVKKQPGSHLTPWRVDCLNSARETILHLGAATITYLKSLQVKLSLPSIPAPVIALVDSGSSDCFVNSVLVSKYHLLCQKINPLLLTLIDRTINYLVNHVVSLPIRFPCSYSCQIEFFVTKLEGTYPIVLGHNWLTQHNPLVDWRKGTLEFNALEPADQPISPQYDLEPQNPPLEIPPSSENSPIYPIPAPENQLSND